MRRCVREERGDDLAQEAHALKGSGRELGAARLVEACWQVEQSGAASEFAGGEALLNQVESEYVRACEELEKYLS